MKKISLFLAATSICVATIAQPPANSDGKKECKKESSCCKKDKKSCCKKKKECTKPTN